VNIPYSVQRRPDTGVSNVIMGVWLFLASEVMLFGALFSAYAMLRVAAPAWPSGRQLLSLSSGSVNTLLLLVMTGLAWKARAAATDRARVLLLLAHFGKEGKPETVIAKISQETLAEMIGTTRSRVSFFMNKFRKLGFIDYNGEMHVHSSLLNVVLHD